MALKPLKDLKGAHPLPRRTLIVTLAALGLLTILLVCLFSMLHPLPPRVITMATGPEGSAYETFGKRYKILLAKQGIEVRLVPTKGAVDNFNLLRDDKSGVQAGFVMGGISQETDTTELLSLGTVGYEPMWFFSHKPVTDRVLYALKGKKVSVGPEGSDSRALVSELLKRGSLDISSHFKVAGLLPEETELALISDKIDAAVLVSSFASPVVRKLVSTPGIYLANFARADAYVARFPSLTKLVLPMGVADLEKNLPSRDTTLLATKTSLVVRGDIHPALEYLLLEAASQVHARRGVFQKAGEFPAAEALEIPLSPEARHYYKSGRPFLQRYLPFWLAALVEQFVVLVIPILGLMYPLGKGMAGLYGWGMQRRIYLIYGELHFLESDIDKLGNKPPTKEILERMKSLEQRANRIRVASNYMPMLYSLKETIAYVRSRLKRQAK